MKPVYIPLKTLPEFNCTMAVLMEAPDAVSAEDGFYPRPSAHGPAKAVVPTPFFRDIDEELALRIAAYRESPRLPGVWIC